MGNCGGQNRPSEQQEDQEAGADNSSMARATQLTRGLVLGGSSSTLLHEDETAQLIIHTPPPLLG